MTIQAKSVSELIGAVKQNLESSFRAVNVVGEVSNLSSSGAGHWYLTLSDDSSAISVALFKMDAYRNPYIKNVKNGDQVIISGPISVYPKRGTFQLLAKKILPAGEGNLLKQYEILKTKLTREGLFDISLKRDIPKFPKRCGVITALGGAALQDFLNTLKRRSFWGEVIIIPAIVQGPNSAKSLRDSLLKAMQIDLLDVIVITRGGGAIEDLWSFNDEAFIRTMFECPIPIISAVGHQVDYTLCDYASDLRMETPTAAAEVLSSAHKELSSKMRFIGHKLGSLLYRQHTEVEKRVKRLSPKNQLANLKMNIEKQKNRFEKIDLIGRSFELVGVYQKEQHLDELIEQSVSSVAEKHKALRRRFEVLEGKLFAMDPKRVLQRGYSILEDENKNVITNLEKFNSIPRDTSLKIHFHDGEGKVSK